MMTESFDLLQSYDWSGPMFWYSFKDRGTDLMDTEHYYGVIRYDGSFKPSYEIFRNRKF